MEYDASLEVIHWPHPAEEPLMRAPMEDTANKIDIYTDGSKIGGKVGAAAVIIQNDMVIHRSKYKLHEKCSNNQAEQIAILKSAFFTNSGFQDTQTIVKLEKSLSGIGEGLEILSILFETYSRDLQQFQCRNQNAPLCIVLSSDPEVREGLKRISQRRRMSDAAWLLFLDASTSPKSFLFDIDIPFDCKFLAAQYREGKIDLTELYRVADGEPLQSYLCGTWGSGNVSWTATMIDERRNDLHGLTMKGVSIENPPITIVKKKDGGKLAVDGYFGAVWNALQERINFTTTYKEATTYGTLENGTWNGMIEMLWSGEVDVAISEFIITPDRMSAVDFTLPLIRTKFQVFIRQLTHEEMSWDDFLKPFATNLWYTICGCMLLLSFLLSALHNLGRKIGNAEAEGPSRYGLYDSIHCVFGIFCQQGHDFTPKASSCRLVYLTAYLTAVILLSAYSAALISFLTKKTVQLPFRDLTGLLHDGSYDLGMIQHSAEYDIFQKSTDSHIQKVFKKLVERQRSGLPESAEEGVHRVCKGKYAFLSTMHLMAGQMGTCGLVELPDESFPVSMSIALAKNSPYKRIIDRNLQIMRDKGVLKRLRMIWWKPKLPGVKSPWYTVDIFSVSPILVVLAAGVMAAGVFLVLEIQWYRLRLHRGQQSAGH
ncbi:probable glutamate receptor [Periplaneta americana]|uniref:probable glutamate receptor n=1 Tax=Periplaneta americana TaxID=6978 RepID=UPI0037E87095